MFSYLDPDFWLGDDYIYLPRKYMALSNQPGEADLPNGFPGQVVVQLLGLNQEAATGITSWKVTGVHVTDQVHCEKKHPEMRYLVIDLVVKNIYPNKLIFQVTKTI
jgi:hypothetical protein